MKLGDGKLVEDADGGSLGLLNRLTAYDASGRTIWARTSFEGPLGPVDASDGRVAITELGDFTPGTD